MTVVDTDLLAELKAALDEARAAKRRAAPTSPQEVEAAGHEVAARLEALTDDVEVIGEFAARADAAYKRKFAEQMLAVDGTNPVREAKATVACDAEYLQRRITEELLKAKQEAGRNLRAQGDWLRSVNANLRGQVS